ncbi:MAG: acyl-CoA dehydrogenase family protein [Pseudolabrys sp.]
MDFTLSPEIEDIRRRVRAFVAEHVLRWKPIGEFFPSMRTFRKTGSRSSAKRRKKPACGRRRRRRNMAAWACDRRVGRDLRGSRALDLRAAGDPLHGARRRQHERDRQVGTPAQKEKWLRPLVEGKARSAFAMTEPSPGSGSDPGMMLTRAEKKGDRYIIRGRKWFITGAEGAAHHILMAPHVRRSAPRAHRFPAPQGCAGLAHHPPHSDHGAGRARRPLRDRI